MKSLHLALVIAVLSFGAHAQGNSANTPGEQKAPNEPAKKYAPGQKKQSGESAKEYAPGHNKDKDTKSKKEQSKNLGDGKRPKETNSKP